MSRIKYAVILAAGLGSRLPSFSKELPKGFVPIDGVPIVERSIINLLAVGIEKVIIGTGHKSEAYDALITKFPEIVCKRNIRYATTGSMYTLYNLRNFIADDFLLLESDLLYDESGLEQILNHHKENVILASGLTESGDEVFIEVDANTNLVAMSKDKERLGPIYGELTGISKISMPAFQAMNRFADKNFDQNPGLDYEYAMVGISSSEAIQVYKIDDFAWCEIDDEHHLSRAKKVVYPLIKKKSNVG